MRLAAVTVSGSVVHFNRSNAGSLILVGLLFTAMALTAALTFEAVNAEREHQAAVRTAIRDDASIVADDLLHRTIFEFEMFLSRPLRAIIGSRLLDQNTLPSRAQLAADGRVRDVAFAIEHLFVVDSVRGTVTPPLPEPLQQWALQTFPAVVRERSAGNAQQTYRFRLNGEEHLVVYGISQLDQGRIFAFTVRDAAIGALAARAFSRRSAFPGILGRGSLTNDAVFIRMSRGKEEIFRSPGTFDTAFGATMQAPPAYGDAVRGLTVQCSFARSAIPALIPGGLPRSRLPLLVVMLATSATVLVTAFVVLRRQRQLADIRSDFVSGVSHELRTPLTQIRMFSETLLLDRVRSGHERQRSLRIISEEAQRLTNLVDNVLFLSRGPRAGIMPSLRACDVAALVVDAVDAFAPLAIRREAIITVDTPPRLDARVDAEAWKQVLTNMLDNAVKYGPAGQTVHVRLMARGEILRLEVDDEGPGVPAADRDSIWRRFHRLDRDRGTSKSGSGIGLAIVREIVAAHGGRCWAEESAGGGARFVVEAPVVTADRRSEEFA
jgi:signal transduction histidine kinase